MAESSNEAVEGEGKPQVSLAGLQRISTKNTNAYDRHGNKVPGSGTDEVGAPSSDKQKTSTARKAPKVESKGELPDKRRSIKQSSDWPRYEPLRKVPPGAETKAILLLAQDLHVFPDDARELVSRYETVRKISIKLPVAQRRNAALRVMKLSPQHYDQFLRAWKRYVLNRNIAAKPVQDDEGDRKIALAMNVDVFKVRLWRKRITRIIEETRLGNDYLHFDRVAVQMDLSKAQLKQLISIDPAIAKAMRMVNLPKPKLKVTRVPTRSHTNLKEPKRAPGVRIAGLSEFESKDQCPSCGVATDVNASCRCR